MCPLVMSSGVSRAEDEVVPQVAAGEASEPEREGTPRRYAAIGYVRHRETRHLPGQRDRYGPRDHKHPNNA